MELSQAILWNSRGLIPGPLENGETFQKRVDFCLDLKNKILAEIQPPNSITTDNSREQKEILEGAFHISKELFDITPDWVPLFFSNYRLSPWHAAVAWIFQLKEHSPTSAFLQLRKSFYHSEKYLDIYERNEVVAHELAHVGRMVFEQNEFEEMLAYRTSKRKWIRWLGPLFSTSFSSRLFVIILFAIFALDLTFLFFNSWEGYVNAFWLKLIPIMMLLITSFQLKLKHRQMDKTLGKLKELFYEKASAVLYRLTDREIKNFAVNDIISIKEYIYNEPSLRWQIIRGAYLKAKEQNG